jgi:hypothetical protein
MPKGRSRYRSRIAAVSIASFLALLGYEAGRLHQGGDPALARTKAASSTSKKATQTTQDQGSSTAQDGTGSSSSGDGTSGDGYNSGGGGYYTPPSSDPPTTGSS